MDSTHNTGDAPDGVSDNVSLDQAIADLLSMLLDAQRDALTLLSDRRRLLSTSRDNDFSALAKQEEDVLARLQECQSRRSELLQRAQRQGLRSANVAELAADLPVEKREVLDPKLGKAREQANLLRHESLANWVVVQKTLIHLSQMLEIIATGGRLQPTYGKGESSVAHGSLLDQAI